MDEAQLQLALTHHKAGRLAQAETIYRQILTENPRQPTVLNYQGVLALQRGQTELAIRLLDRAVAAFSQAIRLNPQLAVVHNNLGILRAALGDFESAIASYGRAVEIQPD